MRTSGQADLGLMRRCDVVERETAVKQLGQQNESGRSESTLSRDGREGQLYNDKEGFEKRRWEMG